MAPKKEPEPEEEEPEPGSVPVPPSLAWTDLTLTEMGEFLQKQTPEDSLAFVADKFGLTDFESNAQSSILVDFYLWILTFAKESGFNEEKSSAAFTIIKKTHEFALSGGGRSIQDAFEVFRRLVLQHSLTGVPDSVVLFSPEDVKLLTAYVTRTYLQHYRLYQLCHREPQALDQHAVCLFVCSPAAPPPLSTATDEAQPAAASAEASAAAESSGEAKDKDGKEDGKEEGSAEGRVAAAVGAVLAEKGAALQAALDDKIKVKLNTINQKLAGMGV